MIREQQVTAKSMADKYKLLCMAECPLADYSFMMPFISYQKTRKKNIKKSQSANGPAYEWTGFPNMAKNRAISAEKAAP
ncbi:hypothetical protein ASF12_09950 [Paenibacillus sp. Leaf72]|nr:hypothetical protein ASF12_09950 [Paenibacillus sp. Leaf72]